jgi:mannose-6-phosphate isomerase-like protein (cupin superfamily)
MMKGLDFRLETRRAGTDYMTYHPHKSGTEMPLQRYNLDIFTKGWFVGNFSPTLAATDAVEVAVKHYRAGEAEGAHYHKVATELTLIVSGRVRMSGEEVGPGEIIKIEPGQATDFVPLTDVTTVVVKLPCVKGDKYLGAPV